MYASCLSQGMSGHASQKVGQGVVSFCPEHAFFLLVLVSALCHAYCTFGQVVLHN